MAHIRPTGDGKYVAEVTVTKPDGKQLRQSHTNADRGECERWAARMRNSDTTGPRHRRPRSG